MSQDQPQRLSLLRPEPTAPPGSTADELGHRLDELAAELAADHQRMLSVLDQAIRRLAPNPQVDRLASLLDEAIARVNGAAGAPTSPPPHASGADAAYASVWGAPADPAPAPAPVTPAPSAATAGIAGPDVTAAPVPPAAPVAPPEPVAPPNPVAPPKPVAPPEPATPPTPVAPFAPAPLPAPVEPPAPAATTVTPRPVWQSNLYAVAAAAIVLVLAILFVNVV